MKYKNVKTGAIIDVESKVSGENWESVVEEEPEKKETSSKKDTSDDSKEGTK